jgi:hypothetical protein
VEADICSPIEVQHACRQGTTFLATLERGIDVILPAVATK